MNNSPFNGDNILTPIFQPSNARTPGNIIINNKCGLTALMLLSDGTDIYPNSVAPTTRTTAVIVPSKQLNVEYRKADQPLNSLPPIV
jgi:hypothetical protein